MSRKGKGRLSNPPPRRGGLPHSLNKSGGNDVNRSRFTTSVKVVPLLEYYGEKERKSMSWRLRLQQFAKVLFKGSHIGRVVSTGSIGTLAPLALELMRTTSSKRKLAVFADAVTFVELVDEAFADDFLTPEETAEIARQATMLTKQFKILLKRHR
jgi:hypothetical protein